MKTSQSFRGPRASFGRAPISSCPSSATISPTLKRVLIVDDNPLVRKANCSLFTLDGFSVCGEAGDGAQAIEQAKQTRPDLIVLDFSMPVMNGIQAAKILNQVMPHVPIILFTAHVSKTLEEEGFAAGIASVFSKDQDTSDLLAKAHELLGVRQKGMIPMPSQRKTQIPTRERELDILLRRAFLCQRSAKLIDAVRNRNIRQRGNSVLGPPKSPINPGQGRTNVAG